MPTGFRKKYILTIIIFSLPACAAAGNIDTGKVEQSWLQRNNELRASLDLPDYTLDQKLSTTAQEWSNNAVWNQKIDHKRTINDGYYNYSGIENRFLQRGVKFKNVNRATFSESLGYGYFVCKKDDCTEDLIAAVKSTWVMYMKEKTFFGLHYKALVHPYFQTMGLGVSIDPSLKRYYLTIHYASEAVAINTPIKKTQQPSLP